MTINPELHYLDHLQNNSIGKNCFRFAKAPRFQLSKRTTTDFNYHPRPANHTRSCSFGFGERANLVHPLPYPSPNKYNISKFPNNHCSTRIGFSREEVIFGTIAVQINQKAKIPAPGAYQSMSSLKTKRFTLKNRLPHENSLKAKARIPGPGQYQTIGINDRGHYPVSNIKNVRYILMDGVKKQHQTKCTKTGPGTYDLFNTTSAFNYQKIEQMRRTRSRPFGTDKRKGPEQKHRLYVPGPGMYDTFSSFGNNGQIKFRAVTQY